MTLPPNPKQAAGDRKPPLGLVPPSAIVAMAEAMADGAAKYGAYNWRDLPVEVMTYLHANLRHVAAFLDGEECAPDSGRHHLAHAMASLAIVYDAIQCGCAIDNRPKPGAAGRLIEAAAAREDTRYVAGEALARKTWIVKASTSAGGLPPLGAMVYTTEGVAGWPIGTPAEVVQLDPGDWFPVLLRGPGGDQVWCTLQEFTTTAPPPAAPAAPDVGGYAEVISAVGRARQSWIGKRARIEALGALGSVYLSREGTKNRIWVDPGKYRLLPADDAGEPSPGETEEASD